MSASTMQTVVGEGERMGPSSAGAEPGRYAAGEATRFEPVAELTAFLTDLYAGLKQLAELASAKLAAIRVADAAALLECARQEEDVLKRVLTQQQHKAAVLARAAQSLHVPVTSGGDGGERPVTLAQIAARLREPLASQILAKSEALRATATDLQRKNRIVATVAQNLQGHIRSVFAEMARGAQESIVYDAHGQQDPGIMRSWVEAVGEAMAILGAAFQIGSSALAAYQAALATVGQNISNVGNADYTRQSARLAAVQGSSALANLSPGLGVDISQLQRHVDEAVESRLRIALSTRNGAQTSYNALSQVESLYDDLGDGGLATQLSDFFNSFANLQTDPADGSARDLVLTKANTIIRTLQRQRSGLLTQIHDLNDQVQNATRDANSMAAEIADLNGQIVAAGAGGRGGDSALRDRRDTLMRNLSELVDVQAREQSNGVVNVYVGSAPLVEYNRSRGLSTELVSNAGVETTQLRFTDNGGPATVRDGQLAALVDARDNQIKGQLNKLDQLAHGLVYEVNRVHANGQGLVGYTSITGDFAVRDAEAVLTSAAAGTQFPVKNGTFLIHLKDQASGQVTTRMIQVDLDGLNGDDTSLASLAKSIHEATGLTTTVTSDNRLQITAAGGQEVSFSEDSSGVLAALGIGTFFSGTDVTTMAVSRAVRSDPRLIATSANGAPGDGSNAGRLAAAGSAASSLLGGLSIEDFHGALTNQVSVDTAAAQTAYEAADTVYSSLQSQREAVSGVNLDEEAVNLTMYERSFQGASRYISVLDTLADSVLSLVQ